MQLKIQQKELLLNLSKIGGVIPRNASIPVLTMTRLECQNSILKLSGTDLEMLAETITDKCQMTEFGSCLVEYRKFKEIIAQLSGEISLTADAGKLKIMAGKGKYSLPTVSVEDWPRATAAPEYQYKFPAEYFKKIISDVQFCVTTDELRTVLMGTLFKIETEIFSAVATDGHRLSELKFYQDQVLPPASAIVTTPALELLKANIGDAEQVELGFSENFVFFRVSTTEISAKVIEGKFPKYESVIPKENRLEVTVSKSDLLAAVGRCLIFSDPITKSINFKMADNSLSMTVTGETGEADETVPCKCNFSNEFAISFNAEYLKGIISKIQTPNVLWSFGSSKGASLIYPCEQIKSQNQAFLLMPIRMAE